MTPLKVVAIFVAIGVAFIPTGVSLMNSSNAIYEKRIMYDGSNQAVSCSISDQNEGKVCSVSLSAVYFLHDSRCSILLIIFFHIYRQNFS